MGYFSGAKADEVIDHFRNQVSDCAVAVRVLTAVLPQEPELIERLRRFRPRIVAVRDELNQLLKILDEAEG